jgi:hypothetical protein
MAMAGRMKENGEGCMDFFEEEACRRFAGGGRHGSE